MEYSPSLSTEQDVCSTMPSCFTCIQGTPSRPGSPPRSSSPTAQDLTHGSVPPDTALLHLALEHAGSIDMLKRVISAHEALSNANAASQQGPSTFTHKQSTPNTAHAAGDLDACMGNAPALQRAVLAGLQATGSLPYPVSHMPLVPQPQVLTGWEDAQKQVTIKG